MKMHVAVAIVSFRNPGDVVQCLRALAGSTHADFEVVICENGGSEAHARLTAALPAALPGGQAVRAVLAPGNLGYAGGVNVCLEAAPEADAWWVLNPDTQPAPEAMAALVEELLGGDCDAVGCTIHLPDMSVQSHGGLWQPWLARAVSIGHGSTLDQPIDAAAIRAAQNYLNGASMMVGRRFRETVGLMHADYFLYCEEVEWCLRGLARGMRLGYAPGARVLHEQGTTTGAGGDIHSRPRTPVYLGERNQILVTRECFPARLPVVAAATLAILVIRYARRAAWRQLGYAFSGWVAGLRDERGAPRWLPAHPG